MNRAMQLHAHAAAARARVHAVYGTGNGSWSISCFTPMTDHKPRPRRTQVTIS
jgi:hypothetical protein